jgi:hypothetical protein
LFALRNETIAFQVVISADAAALDGVTVDMPALSGPAGATIQNAPSATDPTNFVGRPIERFVEHYFNVTRASGGSDPAASLGWASGSGPAPGAWTGLMPDALIPIEVAPSWDPYPIHVEPNRNAVVWIDVTVPATQPAGTYRGTVTVAAAGQSLAALPLELEIAPATLPDRPVGTMLYYDRSELDQRIGGGDAAEQQLWKLYHRHRLSPMHDATTTAAATRHLPALTGSIYSAANGYDGPGIGLGDGVMSLGAYGAFGAPGTSSLASVEAISDVLASGGVLRSTDAFVYAIDESCGSSYGQQWKKLLAGSTDPNAKNVRVGWTCSEDPRSQPVDIPIVFAGSYDPAAAQAAGTAGKSVWIYNGQRPETDAFLTDTSAIALRANGWIAAMANIPRWFYWETTFWYDNNRGGHGAYDPFDTAETFHNSSGDWAEGDGVLVYPGKQIDQFTNHSIGLAGVLPSIRLKNLRRGIEDAGYYELALAANPSKAQAIAQTLLPRILSAASDGDAPSWTDRGDAWFQARKALLALIPAQPVAPAPGDAGTDSASSGVGAPADAATPPGDAAAGTTSGGGGGTVVPDAGSKAGSEPGSEAGPEAGGTPVPDADSGAVSTAAPSTTTSAGGCASTGHAPASIRAVLAAALVLVAGGLWRRRSAGRG